VGAARRLDRDLLPGRRRGRTPTTLRHRFMMINITRGTSFHFI
jgi:hypothetical protein